MSLRDLRRKMKAIKSTRQVTKAMELISASKMRRAVQGATALRSYAQVSWNILERIARGTEVAHPSMQPRPVKRVLAVLITTDRGLCGSLNTQLFRALNVYMKGLKNLPTFEKMDFIVAGRKGQQFLARSGHTVLGAFPAFTNHPKFKDVLPISRMVTDAFLKGDYDHVVLLYPDFISALVQDPTIRAVLPLSQTDLKEMLASLLQSKRKPQEMPTKEVQEFAFEPSPQAVLDLLIPQLTELQVYQAILEAAASEHSARMVAMKNASDSASDILDDLNLTYNQTRQAAITAELSELSAAKAALEQ